MHAVPILDYEAGRPAKCSHRRDRAHSRRRWQMRKRIARPGAQQIGQGAGHHRRCRTPDPGYPRRRHDQTKLAHAQPIKRQRVPMRLDRDDGMTTANRAKRCFRLARIFQTCGVNRAERDASLQQLPVTNSHVRADFQPWAHDDWKPLSCEKGQRRWHTYSCHRGTLCAFPATGRFCEASGRSAAATRLPGPSAVLIVTMEATTSPTAC